MTDIPPLVARRVDFIPLLGLQQLIDPKQEIAFCDLSTSAMKTPREHPIHCSFGKATVEHIDGHRVHMSMGEPLKVPEATGTPGEIVSDLEEGLGGLPRLERDIADIVIHAIGRISKIPRNIPREGALEEAEWVYTLERSVGHQTQKIGRLFGHHLINPYRIARDGIMQNLGFRPSIHMATRIRSMEQMVDIMCLTGEMKPIYRDALGRTAIDLIQVSSAAPRWNQDIAVPLALEAKINSHTLPVNIHRLRKNGGCLVMA